SRGWDSAGSSTDPHPGSACARQSQSELPGTPRDSAPVRAIRFSFVLHRNKDKRKSIDTPCASKQHKGNGGLRLKHTFEEQLPELKRSLIFPATIITVIFDGLPPRVMLPLPAQVLAVQCRAVARMQSWNRGLRLKGFAGRESGSPAWRHLRPNRRPH